MLWGVGSNRHIRHNRATSSKRDLPGKPHEPTAPKPGQLVFIECHVCGEPLSMAEARKSGSGFWVCRACSISSFLGPGS
jgi:hypothetical protein